MLCHHWWMMLAFWLGLFARAPDKRVHVAARHSVAAWLTSPGSGFSLADLSLMLRVATCLSSFK